MPSGKIFKRIFACGRKSWGFAVLGLLVCLAAPSRAAELDSGGLDVLRLRPNFYMIAGAGGNIGVQIGSDGVVLVCFLKTELNEDFELKPTSSAMARIDK